MIDLDALNGKNDGSALNLNKAKSRNKFTQEEDEKLRYLVNTIGTKNWKLISDQMPGRNQRQCSDRWKKYLSPNIVNGPWSEEEDELLMIKYEELGPCWKKIAAFFPTRSDINIKSRWHLKERRIRKENLKMKRKVFNENVKKNQSTKHIKSHKNNSGSNHKKIDNVITDKSETINPVDIPKYDSEKTTDDVKKESFEMNYFDCLFSTIESDYYENFFDLKF